MTVEFSIIRRLLAVVVETHGAELPIHWCQAEKGRDQGLNMTFKAPSVGPIS